MKKQPSETVKIDDFKVIISFSKEPVPKTIPRVKDTLFAQRSTTA